MKQFKALSLLTLTSLILTACSQAPADQVSTTVSQTTTTTVSTQVSEASQSAKIEVLIEGEAHIDKEIEIEAGNNLLDLLKENFTIVDNDGFITTIDGVEQDKGDNKGKYWKISVNGKMSEVGAKDIELKADDVVTLDLTDQW